MLANYFESLDRQDVWDEKQLQGLSEAQIAEFHQLREAAEFLQQLGQVETPETVPLETPSDTNPSEVDFDAQGATIHYTESQQATVGDSEVLYKVGEYELLQELGRGGMGVVFKAQQVKLNRTVAVKMILSGRMASEAELQRFYSEARSVAQLRHPNIVSIYDVQEFEGHHYFSMDFIEGCTLEDIAEKSALTENQIARYVNLIAEAVEYAHQNGILHRDLKPANVLVDADDQPHVTDFGLAKQLEEDSGITIAGTILGTPSFMSPEQAKGLNDQLGPACDIYALGAMLYVLITGKPPFRGKTSAETISMVINEEPWPVRSRKPSTSRALATICEKCLRKNPDERYQSAQEVAVELERFLRGDPIQATPVGRFRRAWVWCREIPVVAALVGRTPSSSNRWQVWLQWTVLSALLICGLVYGVAVIRASMLPDEIRIASGIQSGMYDLVAHQLADTIGQSNSCKVTVLPTQGSIQNRDLLVAGQAHLGLLQASAMDIEQVSVVAPLYREYVHVIVRKDSGIESLTDLKGRTIAMGSEGSGNRVSALKMLRHFQITAESTIFSNEEFPSLQSNNALHAAIVITGLDNSALTKMLGTGKFRLLAIPPRAELFQDTGFDPATIKAEFYPFAVTTPQEFSTLSTAALLVVHEGERDVIVKVACEALTRDGWLEKLPGHFPEETFLFLTKSLPMHPAAVRFYKSRRQAERNSTNQ